MECSIAGSEGQNLIAPKIVDLSRRFSGVRLNCFGEPHFHMSPKISILNAPSSCTLSPNPRPILDTIWHIVLNRRQALRPTSFFT